MLELTQTTDITQQSHLTLEENMQNLNTLINHCSAIYFSWIAAENLPVDYVTDNIEKFGYTSDDFMSGNIKYADIILKEDLAKVNKEVEAHTKSSIDNFDMLYRIVTADGKMRWVENHIIIKRDTQGNVKKYLSIVVDITDKKICQQKLESKEKFKTITENSQIGIFMYQEKIIYANQALAEQSGYTLDEVYSMNIWDFAYEPYKEQVKEIVLGRCRGQVIDKSPNEFKFVTKNGEIKSVLTIVQTVNYNGGYAGVGTIIDITDIIKAEDELKLLAQAVKQTNDMIKITERDGTIIFINDSVLKHTKYERSELIGQTPRIFKSQNHDESFYKKMWSTILSGETFTGTLINKKKDGSLYHEYETITPIKDKDEQIKYFVVTAKDITERIKLENELYRRATIDSLTGIYNRQKCNEQIEIELERYRRYQNGFALIMIDIDNFKHVNDTFGHDIGDDVLKEVSKLISHQIRKSDTFYRWGGEEFIVIAPGLAKEDTFQFSQKIIEKISSTVFDKVGHVTISIGATFPKADDKKENLLKRADIALYVSKNNGRNQVNLS